MTFTVWAYSESEPVAGEVASAASELAKFGGGVALQILIGDEGGASISPLRLTGTGLAGGSSDSAAQAITKAATSEGPSVILVGGTRKGREVAGRVAAGLGWGCISDASKLRVDSGAVVGERTAYAGRVTTTVSASYPCLATVKLGSYPRMSGKEGSGGPTLDVGAISPRTSVVGVERKAAGNVDLKSAKLIVSAGRGFKKKEDLALAESLARLTGGALGCSRPLSSDLGWLPEEHHIGLTGVNVKPDLYLAVGISGQLQHIAGMKDSKVVASINADRDAPIFQASDYGVVGDLYQLLPAIERAIKGE